MNKDSKNIEAEKEFIPEENSRPGIKNLIDGTILTRDGVFKQVPFFMFLTVLAILYIGNRLHAEKIAHETAKIEREIKELRAESISITSELLKRSNRTEVERVVKEKNLTIKESFDPPKKIVIKEEN